MSIVCVNISAKGISMSTESSNEQNTTLISQQGGQVAVPGRDATQVAIEQVFGALGGRTLDNFDGDHIAKWRLTAIATGPNCKRAEEVPSDGIAVKYFYVHAVQLDGPTPGEVVDALRCVLLDDQANAYAFVSNGVARDLARMIAVFGIKPWIPAVKLTVQANKGKGNHTFYTIVPL